MREQPDEGIGSSSAYESLHLPASVGDALPLVLLHGSNGDERDLLSLAGEVWPGASRLAVRGDVATRPGYAFFRRFPDRQVDVADLRSRASRLVRFIGSVAVREGWDAKPIAVGYSNGAIMATALLLDFPDALAGAILLRPLLPFAPAADSALADKPVLVVDGRDDQRRAPEDGPLVSGMLRSRGAIVEHGTSTSGHSIGPDDVSIARTWTDRLAIDRQERG